MQNFLVFFTIWLLILTGLSVWIFIYFRKLGKGVEKGNLIKILEKVLEKEKVNTKNIANLKSELDDFGKKAELHVQKVALVRFNPFAEMGGNHSFSLALLNGRNDGIIITGLHTREKTRVYIKNIKSGKSKLGLSSEEKKALRLAQKS